MNRFKLILNLGFLKEGITSLIPTFFAYIDIFDKSFSQNSAIGFAIATFLLLFVILIFVKVREYKKSVSRALANSYYKNFAEKLVNLCVSKGDHPVKFYFADGEKEFTPKQLRIEIFLEDSHKRLVSKNNEIKNIAAIAYVDKNAYNYPFFVWAKVDGDKILIYDLPRILLSLKDYIDPDMEDADELDRETKTFYREFNRQFKKMWMRLDKGGLDIRPE